MGFRASVRHGCLNPAIPQPHGHGDAASWRCEPHGVVEEGGKDLSRSLRVPADRQLAGGLHVKAHFLGGCPCSKALGLLREGDREIEGLLGYL